MVSTLHTSARAVLLAALVGGLALGVPPAARAQAVTPEQALLNRVAPAPGSTAAAVTQAYTVLIAAHASVLDGERALLNRSQDAAHLPVDLPASSQSVVVDRRYPDGARALLNRSGF